MTKKRLYPQIENITEQITICIEQGRWSLTQHAIDRHLERKIELSDVLYVLKTGYHEKRKTSFDEHHKTWKYALRGNTVDGEDMRVIVTIDNDGLLIITVMYVTPL